MGKFLILFEGEPPKQSRKIKDSKKIVTHLICKVTTSLENKKKVNFFERKSKQLFYKTHYCAKKKMN